MANHVRNLVERHPAHALLALADPATDPQAEDRQHHRQRASVRAQHDAEAKVHHPDPAFPRRIGGCLPFSHDVGEKSLAGGGIFGKPLPLSVAVVADGRCRQQGRRRPLQGRECSGQQPGTLCPAPPDPLLALLRPEAEQVFPREVYYGSVSFQSRGIDLLRRRRPVDPVVASRRLPAIAHHPRHGMPGTLQIRREHRAQHSRGAGDRDSHQRPRTEARSADPASGV